MLGERVAEGRLFAVARVRAIAVAQRPLVEAGMLPAILLGSSWAGVYSRHAGALLALGVSVLQLVAWGVLAGRRTQPTWRAAIRVGLVDGLLGIGIVVLEVRIH